MPKFKTESQMTKTMRRLKDKKSGRQMRKIERLQADMENIPALEGKRTTVRI